MKKDYIIKNLNSEEMAALINKDEVSIREACLMDFLLVWKRHNAIDAYEFATVVEHIRFTNMSQADFFRFMRVEEVSSSQHVKSLRNGKRKHDAPVQTRAGGETIVLECVLSL